MKIRFDTPDFSDTWNQAQQARFEAEALRQLGLPGDKPDWVFAYFISSGYGITKDGYHLKYEGMDYDPPVYPKDRNFKVCGRIADMHHFPDGFWNWLNDLDVELLFFAYPQGTRREYELIRPRRKAVWLPWSVDPEYYYPHEKEYDVSVLGVHGRPYPLRSDINKHIEDFCKLNNLNLLKTPRPIHGISPTTPVGSALKMSIRAYGDTGPVLVGDRYTEAMGKSRIVLTGTSIHKYPVKRIFQALASGCVLMTDAPRGSSRLGLVDGENYLRINVVNWRERLHWILNHRDKMRDIQEAGRQLVLERHTHKVRVRQMFEEMSKI